METLGVSVSSMFELPSRLRFLKSLSEQPFVRMLLIFWAASGAWDLALSEWIPEEYSKHLPRIYQIIAMTLGPLSWQIWVMVGFMILALAIFEYAYRRNEREPIQNNLVNPTDVNGRTEQRRLFTQDNIPSIIAAATLFCLVIGITTSYLYNRATGFPTTHPYQQEANLLGKEKLVSTAFRNVFKCQLPDTELTPKEKDKALIYFKEKEKVIEELYGIAIKINEEESAEIYPLDPKSFKFGPFKKMVLEQHRVDDNYIVAILRYEFEDDPKKPNWLYRILGLFPVPEDPKVRNGTREMVEKLLGVENKGCELM